MGLKIFVANKAHDGPSLRRKSIWDQLPSNALNKEAKENG